jgi:hypothetical protein
MFLGNQKNQNLANPQSLNAYAYSQDNPIIKSDPTGKQADEILLGLVAIDVLTEAAEDYTPSVAEQAALAEESTPAEPLQDLSKNPKWIEIVGQAPTYGLNMAPITNGPDSFTAPYLGSTFMQVSAPIVAAVGVGTIVYRSTEGVTDSEDPNSPTVPHVSQQSTISAPNGQVGSANSQNSGGGSSQGEISNLVSELNQLTVILNELQSEISSQNTNSSSKNNK